MKEITLEVIEALPQDVGSGRARLGKKTVAELDVSYGEIVEIEGSKRTGVVAWRSRLIDEGERTIRVDNLTRKNAGVEIGGRVIVRKAVPEMAKKVMIAPAISEGQRLQLRQGIEHLAKRGLLKRPVISGDIVIIPGIVSLGYSIPFLVCYTKPRGLTIITEETDVVVSEEPAEYPFQLSGKDEIMILENFIKKNPNLDEDVRMAIQQLVPIIKRLDEVRKNAEMIKKNSIDLCAQIDMLLEGLDCSESDKDE